MPQTSTSPTQFPLRGSSWPSWFDPHITMGNLLTIITLIAGMGMAWLKMEGRVTQVENTQARNQVVIEKQTAILEELQIDDKGLSTLLQVYIPEIEGLKRDRDAELEQRQGRR